MQCRVNALPIIISSTGIVAVAVSRLLKCVYFNVDSFNNHLEFT